MPMDGRIWRAHGARRGLTGTTSASDGFSSREIYHDTQRSQAHASSGADVHGSRVRRRNLVLVRLAVKERRGSVTTNESYGMRFTGYDEIRYHWHMSKSSYVAPVCYERVTRCAAALVFTFTCNYAGPARHPSGASPRKRHCLYGFLLRFRFFDLFGRVCFILLLA